MSQVRTPLHWGNESFIPTNYRQCTITVMDNIADSDITFDKDGVCNYYYNYQKLVSQRAYLNNAKVRDQTFNNTIRKLKNSKGQYDCLLGISGGVDSTYLAYLLKENNVNALLVHFDNGWNSELAVQNIQNIVEKTGFDLETFVMDWEEFKDLQRAYFKASVLDLEVPTDHMIFGALNEVARKKKIKYLISGNNVVTEWLIPRTWNYPKFDLVNLQNIHQTFGEGKLKKLPSLGVWQNAYYQLVLRIESVTILDYVDYNKAAVKEIIKKELNWIDYGGKHYESVFTRFYQGYILPNKFGIDKRKAHLSNLILSNQLSREDALKELSELPMDEKLAKNDWEYVAKKLGFSEAEFEVVLNQKNVPHSAYGDDRKQRELYFKIMKTIKPITRLIKK